MGKSNTGPKGTKARLVFFKGIPFVFDLGQGFGLRLLRNLFLGFDVGDLGLWEGVKDRFDQRVFAGLGPQRFVFALFLGGAALG